MRKTSSSLVEQLGATEFSLKKQIIKTLFQRITVTPGCIKVALQFEGTNHKLDIPFHTKRRDVESKIIIGGSKAAPATPDPKLIEVIGRSHTWWAALIEEDGISIKSLAVGTNLNAADVTRFLPMAFLAPEITEAILEGRQPVDLNVERLKKLCPIPIDWTAQRRLLGFVN